MQVFKTALRIFFKHPVYISIYVFWLTAMGVFIGISNVDAPQSDFEASLPDVAIIDRDGSAFSEGLAEFLAEHSNIVLVDDDRLSMQDAIAQDRANYIIIIPENYGADFMAAVEKDTAVPILETSTSFQSISASVMDGLVDEYLNTATIYLSTETATSQEEVARLAKADMEHSTEVSIMQIGQSVPVSQQWTLYMTFSGYTIMLSIIVCVGVVMAGFNRTEVRRRGLVSPVSSLSMNLQIAAASVVITLLCWAWVSLLGLIVFGEALAGIDFRILGLCLFGLLAFCSVPLAVGFLLGQITTSEIVMNAVGNIVGLAFSFLGGIWVSLDLMDESMQAVAHFIPTFYYNDIVNRAVDLRGFSTGDLAPIFGDAGIMLLFSASIFAIALVAGKLRMQSADAGGNAAAEKARS